MKKILGFIVIIAVLAVVAYAGWRYFDNTFKEYVTVAEMDITENDGLYFGENVFVRITDNELQAYNVTDGSINKIYSESGNEPQIIFSLKNYWIANIDGENIVFAEDDGKFTSGVQINGSIVSAHQVEDTLYFKAKNEIHGNINLFSYHPKNGMEDISQMYSEMQLAETPNENIGRIASMREEILSDYCRYGESGKDVFITYAANGAYATLIIRVIQNGTIQKLIELDNFVYNDIDFVKDMLVFYTDNSMLFINLNTSVKREIKCYDVSKPEKMLYNNKIIYYWKDACFDGVNNLIIANAEADAYYRFGNKDNIKAYGNNIIYTSDSHVRLYDFSAALLEDNIIITDPDIKDIAVLGNMVAVIRKDKLVLMQPEQ